MEKHQDVIRQILLLLDTIEEGLVHMKNLIDNLDFESAHELLNDCFLGVISVEEAIKPISYEMKRINQQTFLNLQNQLIESFKETVLCFAQIKTEDYQGHLEVIISLFKLWKNDLIEVLSQRGYH